MLHFNACIYKIARKTMSYGRLIICFSWFYLATMNNLLSCSFDYFSGMGSIQIFKPFCPKSWRSMCPFLKDWMPLYKA